MRTYRRQLEQQRDESQEKGAYKHRHGYKCDSQSSVHGRGFFLTQPGSPLCFHCISVSDPKETPRCALAVSPEFNLYYQRPECGSAFPRRTAAFCATATSQSTT